MLSGISPGASAKRERGRAAASVEAIRRPRYSPPPPRPCAPRGLALDLIGAPQPGLRAETRLIQKEDQRPVPARAALEPAGAMSRQMCAVRNACRQNRRAEMRGRCVRLPYTPRLARWARLRPLRHGFGFFGIFGVSLGGVVRDFGQRGCLLVERDFDGLGCLVHAHVVDGE